jgi:hypothetical protein
LVDVPVLKVIGPCLQALPPAATGAGAATGVALNDAATAATLGAGAGADPPDSSNPVARMFIAFIARSARPVSNSVTDAAYKLMSVPSFNL